MSTDLKVAIIQTELFWNNPVQNRLHFEGLISSILNVDLIVLPETFITGFVMDSKIAEKENGDTIEWMKSIAKQKNAAIAGSYFLEKNNHKYNCLRFVEPNGIVTDYEKKHLFSLTNEKDHFSAGENQVIVNYKNWKIALQICYDLRFPTWIRRTESYNYDIVLFVANWPEKRNYAWHQLLIARAIENQSYVVACNRIGNDGNGISHIGNSMCIDPMGEIISSAELNEEKIVHTTLSKEHLNNIRTQFPFWNDRDTFDFK